MPKSLPAYRYPKVTFTPAEAQHITGASVELQRDWRRRGLEKSAGAGKKAKHTRWEPIDLARLLVRKQLSLAGVSVTAMEDAVDLAQTVILARMEALCRPHGDLPTRSQPDATASRYVVCPFGGQPFRSSRPIPETSPLVWVVLDCEVAARTIIDRAPRNPLPPAVPEQ